MHIYVYKMYDRRCRGNSFWTHIQRRDVLGDLLGIRAEAQLEGKLISGKVEII